MSEVKSKKTKWTAKKVNEFLKPFNMYLENPNDFRSASHEIEFKCRKCKKSAFYKFRDVKRRKEKNMCLFCSGMGNMSRPKINGRNKQVDMNYVTNKIEEICKEKNGKCLNINEYINCKSKLKWKCKYCENIWEASYNNVINHGSWCTTCIYRGESEMKCRTMFELFLPGYKFKKAYPKFLKEGKFKKLELDGYNKKLKIAFEYNGEQHYEICYINKPSSTEVKKLGEFKEDEEKQKKIRELHETKLLEQQERDKYKKECCERNEVNLLIVKHSEWKKKKLKEQKKYIYKFLLKTVDSNLINTKFLKEKKLKYEHPKTKNSDIRKRRVINYLKTIDYKLKDDNIVISGYRQKFTVICNRGHEYETYMDNLLNRKRFCRECSGNVRYSLKDVKKYLKENSNSNIKVKSEKYKNSRTPLDLKCKECKKKYQISFDNIKKYIKRRKSGKICTNCAKKK